MNGVVVDSSLAFKWLFVEDDSRAAVDLLSGWMKADIERVAPTWMLSELINATFQHVRRGMLTIPEAQNNLREISRFVRVVEIGSAVSGRTLEVAHLLRVGATYDCQYVALAEQLGCELWTADERFWRIAGPSFPFVRWLGQVALSAPNQS